MALDFDEYKSVSISRMSRLFRGFGQQREAFTSKLPWDGSACDRALIAPDRFLEYLDEYILSNVDPENIGPWEIIRERVAKVGLQLDYYIDIEN